MSVRRLSLRQGLVLAVVGALYLPVLSARAAAGELDLSFGVDGKAIAEDSAVSFGNFGSPSAL